MDRSQLLTSPLESLTLADRAVALLAARNLGRASAAVAATAEELEDAPASLYVRHAVGPAVENGVTSAQELIGWERAFGSGSALRDPRVQAFFFGWHERATEILAEIAGAEDPEGSDFRARWFLDSLGGDGPRSEPA